MNILPRSRDTLRPSFAKFVRPKNRGRTRPSREGAGKTGCALHPRSRVPMHIAKNAHEHTGSAEAVRPSLRNGFTAYFVLSPARPGLFVTVARVMRSIIASLTPATGASGPHDFAVRVSHARQSQLSRPPHPTARFVTCATPLVGWDARNTQVIWVKNEAEYFLRRDSCPSGQLAASENRSLPLQATGPRANRARSLATMQRTTSC